MKLIFPTDERVNYAVVDLTDIIAEVESEAWGTRNGDKSFDLANYVFPVLKSDLNYYAGMGEHFEDTIYFRNLAKKYNEIYKLKRLGQNIDHADQTICNRLDNIILSKSKTNGVRIEEWDLEPGENGVSEFIISKIVAPSSTQYISIRVCEMPKELQNVGGGEKHLDIVCEGRAKENLAEGLLER